MLDIGVIKRSITNFYRELDVFKLDEYTRAFKILQIKSGQTLREFLDIWSKFSLHLEDLVAKFLTKSKSGYILILQSLFTKVNYI